MDMLYRKITDNIEAHLKSNINKLLIIVYFPYLGRECLPCLDSQFISISGLSV